MTWIVVGIVVVALVILARIAYGIYDLQWFRSHGVTVPAEVTNVRMRRRSNGETSWRTYTATVRFTTTDGQEVETDMPSRSTRPPQPGTAVRIAYDPADPSRARFVT